MVKKEKLSLNELLEQAIVNDEDMPYKVPSNWVNVHGKIFNFEKGKKPEKLDEEKTNNSIPYVNIKYFETGIVEQYTYENSTNRFCNEKDILIVWDGARSGLVGTGVSGALGSTLCKIKINKINHKYVFYYFMSKYDDINKNGRGTGIPHVDPIYVSNLTFPLPPLQEQKRIVDTIETLFERLDRAKELVQNTLDSFEVRKSAILHKAFTGELTAKWREDNDKEDSGSIITSLFNYRVGLAKTPIEKSKIESIFSYEENESYENLPNGWRYVSLDKLCESFQYGTSNKSDNEGKVVVIRMGNLQSGKIDWNDLAYSSDEEDIKKYILKKGDVLFNRTNSPELVGKTSIYEGEQPAIFAGYLIRIKNYEYLDSYYLNYIMNSSYAKEYCMRVKSDGVNQSNINAQKLAKFEIPFCSLKEQKEIVRVLDNLLKNEQNANELCKVIDKIDFMKKSILARAYRGELNTNNPEEASALGLLKEVLRERAEIV